MAFQAADLRQQVVNLGGGQRQRKRGFLDTLATLAQIGGTGANIFGTIQENERLNLQQSQALQDKQEKQDSANAVAKAFEVLNKGKQVEGPRPTATERIDASQGVLEAGAPPGEFQIEKLTEAQGPGAPIRVPIKDGLSGAVQEGLTKEEQVDFFRNKTALSGLVNVATRAEPKKSDKELAIELFKSRGIKVTDDLLKQLFGVESGGVKLNPRTSARLFSKFGIRDVTKASSTQVGEAEELIFKEDIEKAATRARELGKANLSLFLNKPVPANELQFYVDPSTGERPRPGTTRGQLEGSSKFVVASPKAQEAIGELNSAIALVDTLDGLSVKLNTETNAFSANAKGIRLLAESKLGSDSVAAAYADQKSAFTGTIARSAAAEKGVLTDRDIERTVKGMAQFTDTKQVRDFKFGILKLLLQVSQQEAIRNVRGGTFGKTAATKTTIENLIKKLEQAEKVETQAEFSDLAKQLQELKSERTALGQ